MKVFLAVIRFIFIYQSLKFKQAMSVIAVACLAMTLACYCGVFGEPGDLSYIISSSIATPVSISLLAILVKSYNNRLVLQGKLRNALSYFDYRAGDVAEKSLLIDVFIPPEDAEHRAEGLARAHVRWTDKYGKREADRLHLVHSMMTIGLYWFDRFMHKLVPARKSNAD